MRDRDITGGLVMTLGISWIQMGFYGISVIISRQSVKEELSGREWGRGMLKGKGWDRLGRG